MGLRHARPPFVITTALLLLALTASIAGAAINSSPVNDPAADMTAQDTQAGTTLTALGSDVVVGFFDSGSFGGSSNSGGFTGYSHSNDGGATFTDKGTLPTFTGREPNLAAHKATGSIFFSSQGGGISNSIPVFKSTDGGVSFGAPVNGMPGFPWSLIDHWMAVDNFAGNGNGNIYLCATYAGVTPNPIVVTGSSDGGATFGPSGGVAVSSTGQSGGCQVAVGPDHSVYVAYFRGNSPNALFIRRSTDGAVTFGAEHQIAVLNTTSGNGALDLNGGETLPGGFRSNSFPSLAVNPANGELIVAYNDNTAPGNADVFATWSTDDGATWAPPVVIPSDRANDQWQPTVAIAPNGRRAMFGYYSRADDPGNFRFHHRARIQAIHTESDGSLTPSGRSFRTGPNTPPVSGQDPAANSLSPVGDYDQSLAATNAAFLTSWADSRDGNSFHAHQPDVHLARIAVPQPRANVRVALNAALSTVDAGESTTLTARVRTSGGTGDDVFLNLTTPTGLDFESVSSPGNDCHRMDKFVGCSVGGMAAGTFEDVTVVAKGVLPAGTRTVRANVTTSSIDTTGADDSSKDSVTVNPGSTTAKTYSTGDISVFATPGHSAFVPLDVGPAGEVAAVESFVRLNHPIDHDLSLALISPTGTTVPLSTYIGGSGDNYGAGSNDCAGKPTHFVDSALTPIIGGSPPFAGVFSPEQPQATLAGEPQAGTWLLRVSNIEEFGEVATIGCFNLRIHRSSG